MAASAPTPATAREEAHALPTAARELDDLLASPTADVDAIEQAVAKIYSHREAIQEGKIKEAIARLTRDRLEGVLSAPQMTVPENERLQRQLLEVRDTIDAVLAGGAAPEIMEVVTTVLPKIHFNPIKDPIARAVIQTLEANPALDLDALKHFLQTREVYEDPDVAVLRQLDRKALDAEEGRVKRALADLEHANQADQAALVARQGREISDAANDTEMARLQRIIAERRNRPDGLHALKDREGSIAKAKQARGSAGQRFSSAREVLAMIHVFVESQNAGGKNLDFNRIAETMEASIEQAKKAVYGEAGAINVNFLKPTLTDTLRTIAEKDERLKGELKPEQMEKLPKARDSVTKIEKWVEELGGADKAEHHYKSTVPRIIAYLEFALRGGRTSRINSIFSQERGAELIANLKQAQRNHIVNKLKKQSFTDETERMAAYFEALNDNAVEEGKITQEIITRNSKWAVGKKMLKAGGVVGAGVGLAFAIPAMGAFALPVLAPVAAGLGVGYAGKKLKLKEKLGIDVAEKAVWTGAGTATGIGVAKLTAVLSTGLLPALGAAGLWPAVIAGAAVPAALQMRKFYKGHKAGIDGGFKATGTVVKWALAATLLPLIVSQRGRKILGNLVS